ncbi:hypothetical protein BUALT_Bualt04G0172300 [Buddleja alternifolia]|uniref:Uncharacterized protein n=1 Tax=Buddleja alternifolia TaxID=168488 RepID=A0AAV6XRT7_9LAMI|nr:hypothetical protein BUALT_Bualt04G0172300 [Buddleja alternifolia]
MGSCVSMLKHPASAMKAQLSIGSKTDNLLIPSPVKHKPHTVNARGLTVADIALNSHWSSPRFVAAGSKDEGFFDSQPWLESDCEDDYYSVNGDFTPSRGNTPVHHNFALGKLQVNKSPVAERTNGVVPEPSPPEKKKRLSELFKESLQGDSSIDEENANIPFQRPKSTNGTPYLSGANSVISSETTPNVLLRDDEESAKSAQCCIPRLLSERKKRMSPAHNVG